MGVSLDLLRTFLGVYRAGSVTRAAELLGLAQPTVTDRVRALETALGRPLFERVPRGMAPTPAADRLAARVAGPLDSLEDTVRADLGAAAGRFARTVHLGGPAEFVCARVLPALAPLVTEGLHLRVTLGLPEELLSGLTGGALDLAVCTVRPRLRGLRVEPLCDEEFVLVGAGDGAAGEPSAAPLVSYAENLPIVRRYWRTVFGTRPTRAPALVVPDLRGVLAAVAAGAGVSVLPRYLCAAELADGRLRPLLEPALPPLNTLYLAARSGPASPAAAAVWDLLRTAGRDWRG
ncbi:LysR substrate-binding domain-containing protein [Streptomyces sp. NPDC050560]|uniref:LysR substrate-binding domain-containing protein n=1 Tax=Streptomyces sp. NPDC050560 TaxID=3365630 RepID=UPI00379F922D